MPKRFALNEEHMQGLGESQRERFTDEMVAHLRRRFPDVLGRQSDAWIRELIGEGIQAADGYGLVLERDVAGYVELMVAISPGFDDNRRTPWAKEILTAPRLTPQEKLERMYEHVRFGTASRPSSSGANAAGQPLHPEATTMADASLAAQHPELEGRPVTVDPDDAPFRRTWTAAYREALIELEVRPATSRPDVAVGTATGDEFTPRTGTLSVTVTHEGATDSFAGGNVMLTGPGHRSAVTDASGTARFKNLVPGSYQVMAAFPSGEAGQAEVTVGTDEARVQMAAGRA